MESIKRCTNCGRFLGESSGFNWSNKSKGYRQSECRKCHNVKSWVRRQCNIDYYKYIEFQKWRKNGDRLRKLYKKWYYNNKIHCHNKYVEWKERNPDYSKTYYFNNKDTIDAYSREYYLNNKEVRQKYYKKYRKLNKYKLNNNTAYRRSKMKIRLSSIDKSRTCSIYKLCAFINKHSNELYEVDHIRPLSKDGLHCPDNLQILRADLNRKKYNRYPLDCRMYFGITLKTIEYFKEILVNAK